MTVQDFQRLELRVAQIQAAEPIKGARRLLKVQVELGEEQRTLVAGLAAHYTPEDLIGLKVIILANLEAATICGVHSEGMLLGAGCHSSGEIALLTVNKAVPNGTQVARNRLIDHYRSRRQWDELPETLSVGEEPEEEAAQDLLPYLRETVQALPELYREALVLTDLQGLTQQDLAYRKGISLSGAKSRVQRARDKVKTALLRCFDLEFDPRGGLVGYELYCCCQA